MARGPPGGGRPGSRAARPEASPAPQRARSPPPPARRDGPALGAVVPAGRAVGRAGRRRSAGRRTSPWWPTPWPGSPSPRCSGATPWESCTPTTPGVRPPRLPPTPWRPRTRRSHRRRRRSATRSTRPWPMPSRPTPFARVEVELDATQRRLRGIERHRVPNLRRALQDLTLRLEELDARGAGRHPVGPGAPRKVGVAGSGAEPREHGAIEGPRRSSQRRPRRTYDSAMDESLEGWYTDPYARHEARWMSQGTPTSLVRDGKVEGHDPPPDGSFKVSPVRLGLGGSPSDLRRADDAKRESARRTPVDAAWEAGGEVMS